jgi:hypothetical protein
MRSKFFTVQFARANDCAKTIVLVWHCSGTTSQRCTPANTGRQLDLFVNTRYNYGLHLSLSHATLALRLSRMRGSLDPATLHVLGEDGALAGCV